MSTGVYAVVLAAATALPFAPPTGWVQLPQSVVGVHVNNVWQGPKLAHGARERFGTMVFPFPGTADMLAARGTKAAAGAKVLKTISNSPVNLCGTPARMVTARVQSGGSANILQQEVAVKNGYAYMVFYTRPESAPANSQIGALMAGFCPSGTQTVPEYAMPSGWNKQAEMQMVGAWLGTHPGEMMTLMRSTQMSSLDQVFTSAQNQSPTGKDKKSPVQITMRKPQTMCGYPGMLVDTQMAAGPMPLSMHMALTQGNGDAYVLMYMQMGSATTDPAAVNALNTLCVTGASPSPAPTAAPTPTPTP